MKTDIRFVFIASPYTLGDVAVNVRNSLICANQLTEAGFVPYAPLLSHFWHLLFPHPYEFWCELDLAWLQKCDALIRLPGESQGADREVTVMLEWGRPVFYDIAMLLTTKGKKNTMEIWTPRI